ncbi:MULTISPECIES: alpha/beta fold hydrolase [Variovorax]|jgi:pimeloyl-ACP methyl ester carboxylesterase|uniref:alpha/beta fold hydrolase n=1 Tax=Variovorax TaxID=34072 RepID=UPI00036CE729|nr:alpha/beta fold hydrolase [Variovorax paradoxus]MBW8717651.1 alpha/beta fold hydrolase [Variovorax paradoxus]MBW8891086.1 alpha/beta fold hydrolase [Burkholderiales bacterium]
MPLALAFEALGSGPPVVILHGLFGAGRNWMRVAETLAADHRVYLPDARNHGASPWAESMSYVEMAGDVLALVEQEQLQRPFVIGHSMGGKTAMALALSHPQAIGGIAVIDIAPESYTDQFSSYVSAMRSLDVAGAASRREIHQALADSLNAEAPVDFLMQNLRRQNDRFDWRLNLLATGLCMRELCGFPETLHEARYAGPALFVHGAESDYVRPASFAGIRALFPRAGTESIADAGHWIHADQPAALLCGLRNWLAGGGTAVPQ